MIYYLRTEEGISLPELLISISLFGIVSILFVTIVLTNSRIFSDQKTNIHIASQNRIALDEMTNQIRESAEVTNCPYPSCNPAISSTLSTLVLKIWPIDASGNPFDPTTTTGPDYIVYKQCNPAISSTLSTLVLKIWPIDASGNPFDPTTTTGPDYIVYKLDDPPNNTRLVKMIFTTALNNSSRQNSSDILASGVTFLLFYDADPLIPPSIATKEVSITLTTEGSSIRKTLSFQQTTKANLRNMQTP